MNLKDFGVDIQGYHSVHIGKQIPRSALYPGPALTCPGIGFRNPCTQYTYMSIKCHHTVTITFLLLSVITVSLTTMVLN